MRQHIRFVGLDVHAETISAAVFEQGGTVRSLGKIPNRPESIPPQLGSAEGSGVSVPARRSSRYAPRCQAVGRAQTGRQPW
jgi:hypothetical protein